MAAVDAAAQRQNTKLPIVIDGLNEAEDPRDWKDLLSSLAVTLKTMNMSGLYARCGQRLSRKLFRTMPNVSKYLAFEDDFSGGYS